MDASVEHPGRLTDDAGLVPPGSATAPAAYLRRLWRLRHFIKFNAKGKLVGRNRGLAAGNAWLLLEPALTVAVYYLVFALILGVSRGVDNFLLFLVVGRSTFAQHQSAVLGSVNSVSGSSALMRDTTIPRAALPIGVVWGTVYEWMLSLGIIGLVALVTWEAPQLLWLTVIPLTIGMAMLNLGLGLFLAPILSDFPDLRRSVPTLYRLVFYCSGVMFPVESYIEGQSYERLVQTILYLNPVYGYVKAAQYIFTGFAAGTPGIALIASLIWTVILFPLGWWYFIRRERSMNAFKHAS